MRLALGAERRSVLMMVWRDAIALAGIGTAVGACASLLLGRFARALLYGVSPTDPLSLGAAAAAMLVVAAAAAFVPARRAARVDPVVALRQ